MHAHLTALTENDLVVLERRRLAAHRALLVVVVGADAVAVARITRPRGRLTERRATRRHRRLLLLLLVLLLLPSHLSCSIFCTTNFAPASLRLT